MPLHSHTTSLELSVALRDAGWPQEESTFYWVNFQNTRSTPLKLAWRLVRAEESHAFTVAATEELGRKLEEMVGGTEWVESIASPLASEILMGLPDGYMTYRIGSSWFIRTNEEKVPVAVAMDTPQNALGKLWLFMKKEALI